MHTIVCSHQPYIDCIASQNRHILPIQLVVAQIRYSLFPFERERTRHQVRMYVIANWITDTFSCVQTKVIL